METSRSNFQHIKYRYVCNFAIKYQNIHYKLAHLSFTKEEEFFYHFCFKSRRTKSNVNFDNRWIESGIPDHISFHKDGTIHTTTKKYKGGGHRFKNEKLKTNLFQIEQYGMFPILIDSFYFNQNFSESLPEFNIPGSKNELSNVYTMNGICNFSIIIFICKSVDASNGRIIQDNHGRNILCPPDQKQLQIWYKNLNLDKFIDKGQHPSVLEAFNGWYIIPLISPLVNRRNPMLKNNTEKNFSVKLLEQRCYGLFPPTDLEKILTYDQIGHRLSEA